MSIISPEIEYVDRTSESIRYLEHGWPHELCRWHSHEEYELHLIVATSGKAFIGNYIGEFTAGSLFLIGPHLPHNWVTDKSISATIAMRDMLVQFNQKSIDQLVCAFCEFDDMASLFEQAKSGIEFVGFDAVHARETMEAVRRTRGAERVVWLLRLLTNINQHSQKKSCLLAVLRQLRAIKSRRILHVLLIISPSIMLMIFHCLKFLRWQV